MWESAFRLTCLYNKTEKWFRLNVWRYQMGRVMGSHLWIRLGFSSMANTRNSFSDARGLSFIDQDTVHHAWPLRVESKLWKSGITDTACQAMMMIHLLTWSHNRCMIKMCHLYILFSSLLPACTHYKWLTFPKKRLKLELQISMNTHEQTEDRSLSRDNV